MLYKLKNNHWLVKILFYSLLMVVISVIIDFVSIYFLEESIPILYVFINRIIRRFATYFMLLTLYFGIFLFFKKLRK